MGLKTKIEIRNGRWEINGYTLAEHTGDREVVTELLMLTFRVRAIQSEPNIVAKSAVNKAWLKSQNHRFKTKPIDHKSGMIYYGEGYPNISAMSFVRAMGEE